MKSGEEVATDVAEGGGTGCLIRAALEGQPRDDYEEIAGDAK